MDLLCQSAVWPTWHATGDAFYRQHARDECRQVRLSGLSYGWRRLGIATIRHGKCEPSHHLGLEHRDDYRRSPLLVVGFWASREAHRRPGGRSYPFPDAVL